MLYSVKISFHIKQAFMHFKCQLVIQKSINSNVKLLILKKSQLPYCEDDTM